jgi:hypothetical protein
VTAEFTGTFEAAIELEREDGLRVPAIRLVPDWDDAARGHGAGLVVLAGGPLTADHVDRLARPLSRDGYFVVAVGLGGDRDGGIEDLQAALTAVRALASGRIGVLAIDGAGGVALEAATVLPQLDAVVHASGPLPRGNPRVRRLRASLLIHHATGSLDVTDADLADLVHRVAPARIGVVVRRHPVAAGIFDRADGALTDDERHHVTVAWAQTRDFLASALS